jgi:hypothetical protein
MTLRLLLLLGLAAAITAGHMDAARAGTKAAKARAKPAQSVAACVAAQQRPDAIARLHRPAVRGLHRAG